MSKNKNNDFKSRHKEEYPVVFIRVFFKDDYRLYDGFDFSIDLDRLIGMTNRYAESYQSNSTLGKNAYDELIKARFSPKVNIDEFGTSLIKYLGTRNHQLIDPIKNIQNGSLIVIDIHVDDDEFSKIDFLDPKRLIKDSLISGNLFEYDKDHIVMSFDSKLDLLRPMEVDFYVDLLHYIENNDDQKCTLSNEDLYHMIFQDKSNTRKDTLNDTCLMVINNVIGILSYYKFIDIQYLNGNGKDELIREIRIPNIKRVIKYFEAILESDDE